MTPELRAALEQCKKDLKTYSNYEKEGLTLPHRLREGICRQLIFKGKSTIEFMDLIGDYIDFNTQLLFPPNRHGELFVQKRIEFLTNFLNNH